MGSVIPFSVVQSANSTKATEVYYLLMEQIALRQELILIGGGHAHLQLLRQLVLDPLDGLSVTLISRELETVYSGMLPGYIAGHYLWEDVSIDLVPLCARAKVNIIHAEVTGLDVPGQRLQVSGRPDIYFDLLSINIGSSYNHLINKNNTIGISVRPVNDFIIKVEHLLARLRPAKTIDLTIVGAGGAGVELALALSWRLDQESISSQRKLRLLTAEPFCLHTYNPRVRQKIQSALHKADIEIVTNFKIEQAKPGSLHAEDGRSLPIQDVIWASGAHAQPWVAESGLPVDRQGFILVNENLHCVGVPQIFAAGDAVTLAYAPNIPKSGVYAVRQGAVLHRNIYRTILGRRPLAYKPQKSFLSLFTLGGKSALAVRDSLSFSGVLMWWLKDWIDRRFVEKFRLKPPTTSLVQGAHQAAKVLMSSRATVSEHAGGMRCGGCGSKLPADLLTRTFARLGLPTDSVHGIGDDAAVTEIAAPTAIVQSLDAFPAMLPDPYLVGRICAIHALNDIYAMGAKPLNVLANIAVASGTSDIMEEQLFQTLSGALQVFDEADVHLIGGHSGEGPELYVGFAVTGLQGEKLWSKAMFRPGDQLILTRPIGAGVLLAAHQRGLCSGHWWLELIRTLSQTNHDAWKILGQYDLGGCTDVTGFGLLGHALEITQASRCRIRLDVHSVPALPGSIAAYSKGVESSLQQSNEQALKQVSLGEFRSADLKVKILADPMTSGGFLVGMPTADAKLCLAKLSAAKYQATRVGEVLPNAPGQSPIQLVARSGQL